MAVSLRQLHAKKAKKKSAPRAHEFFEVWLDEDRAVMGFEYPSDAPSDHEHYEMVAYAEHCFALVCNLKTYPLAKLARPYRWFEKRQAETVAEYLGNGANVLIKTEANYQ